MVQNLESPWLSGRVDSPGRGWGRDPSGGGGTPDFKFQGWLNGGKNQNPKKSQDQNLTPKKSHTEFPSHKNFQKAETVAEQVWFYLWNYVAGHTWELSQSSDCFEYPKESLLKPSYPQKILAKIFQPQKSQIENFKCQNILRSSLSLKIWSTPPWGEGIFTFAVGIKCHKGLLRPVVSTNFFCCCICLSFVFRCIALRSGWLKT